MKKIFKIPLEIDGKNWSLNKIYAGVHWTVICPMQYNDNTKSF